MDELKYLKPEWSALPTLKSWIEVVKNGTLTEQIELTDKEFYSFGRIPSNDVVLDHQSISRNHAIIQFKNTGEAFIYDLSSSHGTIVNKKTIKPNTFVKLVHSSTIKFGGSTRQYIFQQPESDNREETDFSLRRENLQKLIENNRKEESNDQSHHQLSAEILQNPKNSLNKWMETNGYELDIMTSADPNSFEEGLVSKLILPLDGQLIEGFGLNAKESEKEVCLNACKFLLDNNLWVILKKKEQEYFSDDEDDDFYDRTKSKNRKKVQEVKTETYQSLLEKEANLTKQKEEILKSINTLYYEQSTAHDELETYMNQINKKVVDMKRNDFEKTVIIIDEELKKVGELIKIAKPSILPEFHYKETMSSVDRPVETRTGPVEDKLDNITEPVKLDNNITRKRKSVKYGLQLKGQEEEEEEDPRPNVKKYSVALPPINYKPVAHEYDDDVEEWLPPSESQSV